MGISGATGAATTWRHGHEPGHTANSVTFGAFHSTLQLNLYF